MLSVYFVKKIIFFLAVFLLFYGCLGVSETLTEEQAYAIAQESICIQNGNIVGSPIFENNTWWFQLDTPINEQGCSRVCAVPESTKTAMVKFRCIPQIPPKMTENEARGIAQGSDCVNKGNLSDRTFYDSNTDMWWIYLDTITPGCSPSCVIKVSTKTARFEPGCTSPPVTPPLFETLNLSKVVTHADLNSFVFLDVDNYSPHPAYYVATNGNDENAGTISSPFATIAHALEIAKEGDAVFVRSGTYATDTLTITQSDFVLVAYPNESVTLKKSNDNVAIRIDGKIHDVTVDRINIDGFDNGIIYGNAATQKSLIFKNLKISNVVTGIENDYPEHTDYLVDGLLVKNVEMTNVTGMGINCGDEQNKCAKNVMIRGVRVFGADNPEDFTGSDSLAMVSSDNILVLGSTFANAPGDSMDFKATRVSVVNSVAARPNRNGIKFWQDGEMINTIIYDSGADAAVVFDPEKDGTEFRMINSVVARHSIRSPPDDRYSYAMTFGYDFPRKSTIVIKNSIIYDMPGPIFVNKESALDIRNNIFSEFIHEDGLFEYGNEKIYNVTELNSKSYAKNNLYTGPMFTNPAGHDFTLLNGSPAIDSGLNGSDIPNFDRNRTTRPKGNGIDIGPYER